MNLPFLKKNEEFPVMIVYLYSNKIPQSVEILNSINPNILSFFRIINIDNTQIINIIKKSTTVKLKNIPSIFVIYKTFIDEVDINQLVHNLNLYINSNNKSFDVIDEEIINEPNVLKKVNKTTSDIKPTFTNKENQRYKMQSLGGLSSLQPRPPLKGSGHKHMAVSSLNDSINMIENDNTEPDNLPDNDLLDANLKIPKNLNNEQKKELIANALRLAEKERIEMIETDEAKQTGISNFEAVKSNIFNSKDIIDDDFNFNDTDEKIEEINVEDYRT